MKRLLFLLLMVVLSGCADKEDGDSKAPNPNPPPPPLPATVIENKGLIDIELSEEELKATEEVEDEREDETADIDEYVYTVKCEARKRHYRLCRFEGKIDSLLLIRILNDSNCVSGFSYGILLSRKRLWVRRGCDGIFKYKVKEHHAKKKKHKNHKRH